MITSNLSTHSPDQGVEFRHIACGQSEIDSLLENKGNFDSFGEYVRLEVEFQRSGTGYGSDLQRLNNWRDAKRSGRTADAGHEKVLRWRDASDAFRAWSARQLFQSVGRAVATPDGMYEQSDPDGGGIIPDFFVSQVWQKSRTGMTPWAMAKVVVVPTASGVLPAIVESSRVTGSRWGGLTANYIEESQQIPTTAPKLGTANYRLKKLAILIPMSDELLIDGGGMLDAFLTDTCAAELEYQGTQSMMNGSAGQPNGMVNGSATISVSKDAGQAAATISASNVSSMWSRLWGPSRANAVFFCHNDFDPDSLALPVSNMTGWNGPQSAPTLKGRPVWPLEACPAIGVSGDLLLCDPSQYLIAVTGIRKSISAHLRWDKNESYLKMLIRLDGFSLWPSAITPASGSLTKSPFVVISQR